MPHLSTEQLDDGARLGLWQITETAAELRAQLGHPELYADTVAQLKPESRREREILAVRCLLRAVAGEEQRVVYDAERRPSIGVRTAEIDVEAKIDETAETDEAADGSGPMLMYGGGEGNVPFVSISHTEGYAAVLLADRPVGIDIERMGPRVARVASHFLQADERERLTSPRELHLAWSAKETAYKLLGREYYDLQRLTRVARIHYYNSTARDYNSAAEDDNSTAGDDNSIAGAGCADPAGEEPTHGVLALEVAGRPALAVHFRTCADYVLTWTLGDSTGGA